VVEGARLESVYTGNRIAGSNPALSANQINALPTKSGGIFVLGSSGPSASLELELPKTKMKASASERALI
jgi:hypothetical protein